MSSLRFIGLAVVLFASACAPVKSAATPAAPSGSVPDRQARSAAPAPARRVELPRTVVTPTGEASIDELYAHARARLESGEYAGAAVELERVVALDPHGPLAPEALFAAGEARDFAGDPAGALARYQEVGRRFPRSELARAALVREIRLLAYFERWEEAGRAADALVARHPDLRPLEEIVAMSGKALALLAAGETDAAATFIERGRSAIEDNRLDQAGRVPRDLAQLYYALGELRRLRAEQIRFVPVPADFAATLEARCQLLLDAQSAYSDAMRAYDAHWSAMSGYRVGELYERLHQELMSVPPPPAATTDADRQLFEGAMRLRYSVLLAKALTMMNHTVQMASRTGERSEWVERAKEARASIERAMKVEDAALARLPYSRADLEAALARLAQRAKR
ncbi:MAG: hypothetical protein OZ921_13090 [Sorangiineae bacterium]|nr:hypothetical protein [Polyangiaceae bacterium]MEB2323440.1 hypothetical protein [Sorangiineae bacterium]